jgi:hypothetical protein
MTIKETITMSLIPKGVRETLHFRIHRIERYVT